jgi:DNA-binding CsgD family transcriptional regulator
MENFRIAVLGLSLLEFRGLTHVCGDMDFRYAESFSDLCAVDADAYIVDALVFVSQVDFFMPKKSKTVIWFDRCRPVQFPTPEFSSSSDLNIVFRNDEENVLIYILEEIYRSVANERTVTSDEKRELSSREKDVLKELASGKTNKEIADALCISVNTVITHRKNISSKLGIRSASGLSLYALMNGII